MKTRKQKQDSLKLIKEKLSKAKITIFTSFASASTAGGQAGQKGLNVVGMRELRSNLRPLDSTYTVEKKTVLDKALKDDKRDSHVSSYQGSIGVAYGFGDVYAIAKALYQFAKKNPFFKLYGALMGSEYLDGAQVTEMALMPSREVLLGRLVGMLSYPMRSLAMVLNQRALKL